MAKVEKTLVQKVIERKRFIEKIVKFVNEITMGKGTMVKFDSCPSHTHRIWRLGDFVGFYFETEFCKHCMDGNEIRIWQYSNKGLKVRVFWLHYRENLDECVVKQFVEGEWQEEIKKAIRNKKRILLQIENKKKRQEKQAKLETIRALERIALQNASKRLGLNI